MQQGVTAEAWKISGERPHRPRIFRWRRARLLLTGAAHVDLRHSACCSWSTQPFERCLFSGGVHCPGAVDLPEGGSSSPECDSYSPEVDHARDHIRLDSRRGRRPVVLASGRPPPAAARLRSRCRPFAGRRRDGRTVRVCEDRGHGDRVSTPRERRIGVSVAGRLRGSPGLRRPLGKNPGLRRRRDSKARRHPRAIGLPTLGRHKPSERTMSPRGVSKARPSIPSPSSSTTYPRP